VEFQVFLVYLDCKENRVIQVPLARLGQLERQEQLELQVSDDLKILGYTFNSTEILYSKLTGTGGAPGSPGAPGAPGAAGRR
jgi:hypothetical protein